MDKLIQLIYLKDKEGKAEEGLDIYSYLGIPYGDAECGGD